MSIGRPDSSTSAGLHETLEALRLMVVQLDAAGRVVFVNRYFREFVGIADAKLGGVDFFAPFLGDADAMRRMFDLYLAADASFAQRETKVITAAGVRRVLWNAWAHRDVNGEIAGVFAVGEDLTEPTAQRRDARHRQAAFLTIADHLPNGFIYQFETRPDGHRGFTFLSAGAADIYELPTSSLVEDSQRRLNLIHPDDRDALVQKTDASRASLEVFDAEYRIRTEAGVEKWLHLRAQPRRLPDGTFRWDGVGLDVTDRKVAEVEASNLRELLEGIRKAQASFIDSAHPSRTFEYLLESLLSATKSEYGFIGEVFYDDAGAPFMRTFAFTNIARNETWQRWYDENRASGAEFRSLDTLIGTVMTERRVVLTNHPATDPRRGGLPPGHPDLRCFLGIPLSSADRLVGIVGIANRPGGYDRSIVDQLEPFVASCAGMIAARRNEAALREAKEKAEADRRQIEKKMHDAQRMESIGVLAGGIAHDFNNLMTSVLGYANLAEAEIPAGSRVAEYLNSIATAARRSAELCQQLLAYAGKGRFAMQNVDLNDIVRDAVQSLDSPAIVQQLTTEAATVSADPAQLSQAAQHILRNALEAMADRSGSVTVTTKRRLADRDDLRRMRGGVDLAPGQFVELQVADTGVGMDVATLQRLFEPFYSTKFSGRGLGLPAAYGVVRAHGGAIDVASEIGRGTTLRILLPFAAAPEEIARAQTMPGPAGKPGRILLVEDEAAVRRMAERMLEALGYEVAAAANGLAALEAVKADDCVFDLALVDFTMPEMDGAQTADAIRTNNPTLPIVLMSGYGLAEIGERVGHDRFAAFLQKPFGKNELARTLAAIARRP